MTDRELLELAAKAAGVPLKDLSDRYDCWEDTPCLIHKAWNPITDDGDALRLAVKLRLRLDIFAHEVWVTTQAGKVCDALSTGDENRMVRVAITRAAAEIGKAMP